ncbi:MAG: histidine--tRNA ligase [Lachnospiraceae bacterium]|nr:histidine--tRNA ligase [Lachnospiraceae bacterium]QUO22694.1 histidine--tRNA ligase [Clostridiaceae bacterium Marseille-Q4143]
MPLKKKPVTGMKDILPAEMQVRDYVTGLIKETYKSFGFSPIETPCVEHIENLCSKQGGDNEKLIFKIMKRGEKLNLETAQSEADLTDSGLRYDLTVPLSRFYSNNANDLPTPFKALQMGSVWRADRPQRGRFRQFVQCDIDILGEPTCLAEIELILATTTLLGKLNFKDFKVRINERRILKAMASYSGFTEDQYDQVFIILDKMDKIGWDGVKAELIESGYPEANVEKYVTMFDEMEKAEDALAYLSEKLSGVLEEDVIENLRTIRTSVEATAASQFQLVFDPTLVRGMSYYTGTIFEIEMAEFGSSVAGGGRYDKMIGKFTGKDTPACGFSIGFERIITILMEQNFQVPGTSGKKAFLIEKNMPAEKLCEVLKEAKAEREAGAQVLVALMNKNKKFQKEQLSKEGYTEFKEFFCR